MGKPTQIGTTGAVAAARLRAVRMAQRLSLREVSERVTAMGHDLSLSAVSKIEGGSRRMDVDDLTALAAALNVAPVTLLLPDETEWDTATVTGATASAVRLWMWATGSVPLPTQDVTTFLAAIPPWLSVLTQHKEQGRASTLQFIEDAIRQDELRKLQQREKEAN